MNNSSQKKQNQLMVICIIVLAAVSLSWVFIYIPREKKFASLEGDLKRIKGQIAQIEELIDQSSSPAGGMALLKRRVALVDVKLPVSENETLDKITALADELGVKIVSIKSQPKQDFLLGGGQKFKIDGKSTLKIFVTLNVVSNFKSLVDYVSRLRYDLPAYCTIEQLKVRKVSTETSDLNVGIDLNIYLLTP